MENDVSGGDAEDDAFDIDHARVGHLENNVQVLHTATSFLWSRGKLIKIYIRRLEAT